MYKPEAGFIFYVVIEKNSFLVLKKKKKIHKEQCLHKSKIENQFKV